MIPAPPPGNGRMPGTGFDVLGNGRRVSTVRRDIVRSRAMSGLLRRSAMGQRTRNSVAVSATQPLVGRNRRRVWRTPRAAGRSRVRVAVLPHPIAIEAGPPVLMSRLQVGGLPAPPVPLRPRVGHYFSLDARCSLTAHGWPGGLSVPLRQSLANGRCPRLFVACSLAADGPAIDLGKVLPPVAVTDWATANLRDGSRGRCRSHGSGCTRRCRRRNRRTGSF